MFKLVIFTQEACAKGTAKNASTMIPHLTLTFGTYSILQRAVTSMCGEAAMTMTYPCFTVVTNGSLHRAVPLYHTFSFPVEESYQNLPTLHIRYISKISEILIKF
jgi:hypothetical protein